jgi:hypothetical protein
VKILNRLLKIFEEYEFEDFGVFAGRTVVLFANSARWDELPESVRTEILELMNHQSEELRR